MDYLDRIKDEDASDLTHFYVVNFMTFLGYYITGTKMPEYVKEEFYNSSLQLKNPDLFTIYSTLKNAPDLNDPILRQMVLKVLNGSS